MRLATAVGVAQSSTAARGLLRQSGTLSFIHGVSAITTTRMPKSRRAAHRLTRPSASFRSLSADELEPNALCPLDWLVITTSGASRSISSMTASFQAVHDVYSRPRIVTTASENAQADLV